MKQLRVALRKNELERSTPVRRDDEIDTQQLQRLLLQHTQSISRRGDDDGTQERRQIK
jgi:hypothetical protein